MEIPSNETRATRREWIGLAVLAFPCFLLSMDFTVLHLAVPALTADLKPSSAQLLWIVDIYGFFIASSLITMGTLGDRIGRRKLLLIGGATFGAASALAAFSTSASMLIVTRALLGVAGATLMPSTLALIRNMFHDDDQRRIAIAVWINSFVVGGAIGPILGGVLLEHFWWGSVFLLNVPVMALLLLLGPWLLPEFRDPNPGRLDLLSAALSLVAMLSIIFAIKRFAQDGAGIVPLTTLVFGIALGWVFVARQRKLEHPLIDLDLFRVPAFSTSVATQLVATMTLGGIYFLVAQYLQLVMGLSPLHAGLALLPATITGILGTALAPVLVRRYEHRTLIAAGMLLTAVGMGVMSRMQPTAGLTLVVISYIVMSFGINIAITLTTDSIMSVAPPERAGAASAVSETSAELGMALGIAILGSVATAAYRYSIVRTMPLGMPEELRATAKATLGGAVAAAKQISGTSGDILLNGAREAFTTSLDLVAAISAVLVISVSLLVLRVKPAT
jgi:MFS transporter, DHA2 family, multidrug resistance protein